MVSDALSTHRRTVGIRDIPLVLVAPARLFARIEDVGAYLWPLLVLLTGMTVVGVATTQTGLIDLQVQEQIDRQKAELEKQQIDIVEKSQIRKQFEELDKQGTFLRVMRRLQVAVMTPLGLLLMLMLISAVFYGLIALQGRRPEWNTLMTIMTYAAFVDLLAAALRLVLMVRYRTLEVDLTLAALMRPVHLDVPFGPVIVGLARVALSALDPFAIWFWALVLLGLRRTGQLRGWLAWSACVVMLLVSCALGVVGEMGAAAVQAKPSVP